MPRRRARALTAVLALAAMALAALVARRRILEEVALGRISHEDPDVRLRAVRSLERLGVASERALAALARATVVESDALGSYEVGLAASDLLVECGPRAVPPLVRAIPLGEEWYDNFGIDWTYRTLLRLGPSGKGARPLLKRRLEAFLASLPAAERELYEPSWLGSPCDHRLLLVPLSDEPGLDIVEPVIAELAAFVRTRVESDGPIAPETLSRVQALIETLRQLGPHARPAVPLLLRIARLRIDEVQYQLPWTIESIEPEQHDAVAILLEGLRLEEPDVGSIEALAKHPSLAERIVPELAPLLTHADPAIRREAAVSLRAMNGHGRDAVDALASAFGCMDAERRARLAHALSHFEPADERTAAFALATLRTRDGSPRVEVLRRLGALDVPAAAAAPTLEPWLAHEDLAVRTWTACALALIEPQDRKAMAALDAALSELARLSAGDGDEVFEFLFERGPRAMPALVSLVASADAEVHEKAFWFLLGLSVDATVLPRLRSLLAGGDVELQAVALHLAGTLGARAIAATDLVEPLTRHPDRELRDLALRTLARIESTVEAGDGGAHAVDLEEPPPDPPELLRRLEDPRSAAGASLELVRRGPAAVGPLVAALDSPLRGTTSWIAFTLGRIGPEAACATPALLRLLDDGGAGWLIRANAVQALGRIAADERPVRLAVERLLSDPAEEVRRYAAVARRRLGSASRRRRDDTDWKEVLHPHRPCGWTEESTYHELFCTR